MKAKRLLSLLLLVSMFITLLPVSAIASWASELGNAENERTNAMDEIESGFSDYKIGETQNISDDGYIGIPVELSIYYDSSKGAIKSGHKGTPVIVYVVNTMAERVGTDTDTEIIQSMFDRGYVVVILDYLNNEKAISPALDSSVQGIRNKVKSKTYFTDSIFPSGNYLENYVVPAGCNVIINEVFWEMDKHGADGILETIVDRWNGDFKVKKADRFVKWVHIDGTRKKVANASDGTSPVWYDAAGTVTADGEYTKVKYTVAETITDCVNPDGSPIDLNQYISVTYPTNPEKPVPVACLANSAGYIASAPQTADRPHTNGFLFNGYASAVFDHPYVPMARDESFGYYDGGGASEFWHSYTLFGDINYFLATAAMRYLRYLSASGGSEYNFDPNAFGYYGNSKGGGVSFLGMAELQKELVADASQYGDVAALENAIDSAISEFIPHQAYEGHYGKSRYEMGITESYTKDGVTIDGGELQPWLTYDGKELISGAQWTYGSNGPGIASFSYGSAPVFLVAHFADHFGNATGTADVANALRTMDIPTLYFEANLGHTLAYGQDCTYGVDLYQAIFDNAGYYLKGEAVKVLYTNPMDGYAGLRINSPIAIAFTGAVTADEITKITLSDESGNTVSGSWRSEFGGTKWYFTPDGMKGSEKYTLTVPATLSGDNGVPMGKDYTTTVYTEYDISASCVTVKGERGDYYYITAPTMPDGANKFVVRFKANGDAANIAKLYAVSGFDASSPDSSTVGDMLGSVNLSGAGYYEIDVTDYVAAKTGETVAFLLNTEKTAGNSVVYASDFSTSLGKCSKGTYADISLSTAPDGTDALKAIVKNNAGRYPGSSFYTSNTSIFTISDVLGFKITEADYGRSFKITLRVYDTASRHLTMRLDTNTSTAQQTMDYQVPIYNFSTVKGEWTELELVYRVYDTDYGTIGLKNKTLTVGLEHTGSLEHPLYISDVTVTEVFTDINADNVSLAAKASGTVDHKASLSDTPFAIYSGDEKLAEYSSWNAALSAYVSGQTLKLQRDYTLTDSELFEGFNAAVSYDIDLNGYEISCANSSKALLWLKNTSAAVPETAVTLRNGGIVLKNTPLVSYDSSTASGAGKSLKVNLDNVNIVIADNAMLKEVISASAIASGADTSVKITLTDCGIDIPDGVLTYNYKKLIPSGTGTLSLEYAINGGYIKAASRQWMDIRGSFESTVFGSGENGYTKFLLPATETVTSAESYKLDNGIGVLSLESENAGFLTYSINVVADATEYGAIPEEYASVSDYPVVTFSNGICVYAGADWASAVSAAGNNAGGTVLLRTDFTSQSSGSVGSCNGVINIDLNGCTFTDGAGGFLRTYNNEDNASVTFTVNVKNGTVCRTSNQALFTVDEGSASVTTVKKQYLNFENITFENTNTASGRGIMFQCWENAGVKSDTYVTYTDCVFDLSESQNGAILFNVGVANKDYANVHAKIYGGEILAGSLSSYKLFVGGNADSFAMGKGTDDNYPVIKALSGGAATTEEFFTVEGVDSYFSASGTDGDYTVYKLIKNNLKTPYGKIGVAYADDTAYPLVIFKDGVFVSGHASWKEAMAAAVAQNGGAVIYLRRDFESTDTYAMENMNTSVTFDLGGNSMKFAQMFHAYVHKATYAPYTFDVTIINGTLVKNTKNPIFIQDMGSSAVNADKKGYLKFDGVTFENGFSDTSRGFVLMTWGGKKSLNVNNYITFNDCSFNVGNNALFVMGANTTIYYHAEINGGKVISDAFSATSLGTNANSNTVVFGKGSDGEYTKLETLASATQVTAAFPSANGNLYFSKTAVSEDTTKVTYTLAENVTSYGTIPTDSEYWSVLDYPFVVFKDNALVGGYAIWTDAVNSAFTAGNGATVYLRRDFYVPDGNNVNLSNRNAQITIDLGGHLLTSGKYIFNYWNSSAECACTVNIKNGEIKLDSAKDVSMFYIDCSGTSKRISITVNFDNITFNSTNTTKAWPVIFRDLGKVFNGEFNLNFNDCTFDFTGLASGAYMVYSTNKANINLSINGGKIVASDFTKYSLYKLGTDDTVTFGKGSDGNYTSLETLASSSYILTIFPGENGDLCFVKVEENGDTAIYRLDTPPAPITTPYGDIPYTSPYYSEEKYPLVVFKDGELKGGYSDWEEAMTAAASLGNGAVLYLRRDLEIAAGAELASFNAKFTVDLGGNTLTSLKYVINGYSITSTDLVCDITFKNGKWIRGGDYCFVSIEEGKPTNSGSMNISLTLENISMVNESSGTGKPILFTVWDGKNRPFRGSIELIINNCEIDLSGIKTGATIIGAGSTANDHNVNVQINGGNIIADVFGNYKFFVGGTGDSLYFGKYEEKYTILTTTGSVPTTAYDTVDEGKALFTATNNTGEYILTPCTHKGGTATCTEQKICYVCNQKYGEIDEDNHNASGEWSSNDTHHWNDCTRCGEDLNKTEHTGGEANCTDKAECSVCGQAYGNVDSSKHNASNEISKNETHHWNDCTRCGEDLNKDEHSYADASDTECDCGYSRGHQHVYNVPDKDDNNHWNKCSCGEIDDDSVTAHEYADNCDVDCDCGYERVAPHNYKTTYETDDNQHWIICEDCDAEKPDSRADHAYDNACDTDCVCGHTRPITHDFSVTDKNNDRHWVECSVCGAVDESTVEDHGFDNACDTDCACGYERRINHDYSVIDKNDTHHWRICSVCGTPNRFFKLKHSFENDCDTECICGYTRETEHVYDGDCDTKCNVCSAPRTVNSAHVYINSCDKSCNVCGETRTTEHTYSNACDAACNYCYAPRVPAEHIGGTATCTKQAACTECGAGYGEYGDHVYGTEWKTNVLRHWHECACGSKTDETVHTFGEVNNGKKSCVCGYTVSDPNYKTEESMPTGAIVAIVIGSVAAVGVVGFGVYFFVFRKKK